MNKEPRATRTVARYDEYCSACMGTIPKGSCVVYLFNYRSHKQCEPEMTERYIRATLRSGEARKRR